MHSRRALVAPLLAAPCLVSCVAVATSEASRRNPAAAAPGVPLLYIAQRGAPAVAAYRADASGSVAPALRIAGAATGLGDPWGLAFDARGSLYVQNYLGGAETEVYAPGAAGNVAPARAFNGMARDAPSVAVDAAGTVYVARFQPPEIEIFPPDARGRRRPTRTLIVDGWPRSLSVDSRGDLIVGMLTFSRGDGSGPGNAIEVFAPGASGKAAPLRRIAGRSTGLGDGGSFGDFRGDTLLVGYLPLTGRIYAAVSGCDSPSVPTHIAVFPSTGNGNIAPVRTIQGNAMGLGRHSSISGIAGDWPHGDIYALVSPCTLQPTGTVLVYRRLASGNAAPIRRFTDRVTQLRDVQAIAFDTRGVPPPDGR